MKRVRASGEEDAKGHEEDGGIQGDASLRLGSELERHESSRTRGSVAPVVSDRRRTAHQSRLQRPIQLFPSQESYSHRR